ncbi:MAG: methionyl-tRNA formyltransferase [Crocinitomicaceae bacterium]|nr:methionyl-tRNA formyltransferase [Crocinitomicaceae bacterium]
MKILFMGTPIFAVNVLDKIYQNNYDIVGVVTAPDKPAGRGKKIMQSDVKLYCLTKKLHLLQPINLKDPAFIDQVQNLKPDVIVVVAFRMLPRVIWEIPKHGTFNLHASLLPNYRGAAPINWAIINGEKESGVTTFFIDEKIDTGAIIMSKKVNIEDGTTAGDLHNELMELGAELVVNTIEKIADNNYHTKKQVLSSDQKKAPKLNRINSEINWNKHNTIIRQFILGLSPHPGAWTTVSFKNKTFNFKIFNAQLSKKKFSPKKIVIDNGKLYIGTINYSIELTEVQIEGKKRMPAKLFLKGYQNFESYTII